MIIALMGAIFNFGAVIYSFILLAQGPRRIAGALNIAMALLNSYLAASMLHSYIGSL